MNPIDIPSSWNPVPQVQADPVAEVEAPDINKMTADAMYAALAQPAHPSVPPSTVAPVPDESIARLQQDKGSAAGEVMHVLAGADSGSIENLVNQAVANRPLRQGPPPTPQQRAQLARRVAQAMVARGDADDSADPTDLDGEEGESLQDILRAGARVLRRAPLQMKRSLRG